MAFRLGSFSSATCSREARTDWIFNTLSVILSRSTLVSFIAQRSATVCFEVPDIGIFRVLLFLQGIVNQEIKTGRLRIVVHNRTELPFMEADHIANRLGKVIEETLGVRTVQHPLRRGRVVLMIGKQSFFSRHSLFILPLVSFAKMRPFLEGGIVNKSPAEERLWIARCGPIDATMGGLVTVPKCVKPVLLHVDDDDLLAYLVKREITGFDVRRVADGEQALQFLNRSGVFQDAPATSLVLLDLHMPAKDGFATLIEIRANPSLANLPVAMFTTSQNPDDYDRALALGADYFILKPSGLDDFPELAARLAKIVQANGIGE